ncbi:hypothetical protein AB0L00_03470 [Actinoallomurus sp. NPDC052308]
MLRHIDFPTALHMIGLLICGGCAVALFVGGFISGRRRRRTSGGV